MTMIEQFPPAERTVPRMLAQQQARFGARQALVIGDQSWSHAQVQQMAACRASVLQTVAQRIQQSIRAADTACRIGGDEFLLILTEAIDATSAAVAAQKIIELINQPIDFNGQPLQVHRTPFNNTSFMPRWVIWVVPFVAYVTSPSTGLGS